MQSRDWRMYMEDMLDCCRQINLYTTDMNESTFVQNRLVYDATTRNLEIIGEAATHVPAEIRARVPEIAWQRIVGLRNILIHAYLIVDNALLWEIIQHQVPELERQLEAFLDEDSH